MLTPAIVGVMFGLSVALPFGPVSLMCIQRTLADGLRSGLVAGAGAVTAQGIFAPAALYGRDLVAAELALWSGPIREFSALLLIALGLRMLLRRNKQSATAALACAQAAYGSTLALALSTPITVLPYLGVASGTAAAAVRLAYSPPGPSSASWSAPAPGMPCSSAERRCSASSS